MKKIILLATTALILANSCKDYLDINRDPNSPSEANMTASMMFPGAEMALATEYGDFLRITGGYFSQYYAHQFGTSNYLDYSQFTMSATRSSTTYSQLNTICLNNMNKIIKMATLDSDYGSCLAATVIRAFTYQVLVDMYGEIPYSEAGNLELTSPKYDDGQTIYSGVIAELDEALKNVTGSEAVCTNLLFTGEKADSWIKFANLLKFKMYMRMGDLDKAGALVDENLSKFPSGDIKYTCYTKDESGQANPFYQEEFATYFGSTQINVILNLALMSTMKDSEDARLAAFFAKNSSGEFTGGVSGTNFSTSTQYKTAYFCRPNVKYNDPVYLISLAEQYFFVSEYYAKKGNHDKAENFYNKAVEASFKSAGVSGEGTVLSKYPYDKNNYMKCIGIQKWVALSGTNPFEGWCELRRIKFPAMGVITGEDIYSVANDVFKPELLAPATLYTPILYNTKLGAGKVLQRYPYPNSSTSRNSNAPENKGDSTPVFWAN